VATKRKQLDLKTREINWLIGKHSPLSLENKLLIYKAVLKPVGRVEYNFGDVLLSPTQLSSSDTNPNYSDL